MFVVDKDNIIRQREITISGELPDLYIILSGITEKDKIILEGIRKVRDEEKIAEYKFEDMKSVLPRLKVYVE